MPMDSTDIKVVREILAAIRSGDDTTHRLLRRLGEQLDRAEQRDAAMLDAFNRAAKGMEDMAREIRALRTEMNPPLTKPASGSKLRAAPPTKGAQA